MDKPRYRKLAGRSMLSYQRLYLGDDHILTIDGYITETYRRFYFRDLRAVVLRRTRGFLIANTVLIGLIFIALLLASPGHPAGIGFGVFIGGIALVCFLINLVKGATCRCQFVTRVQSFRVDALHRQAKAHWVLERILPRVREAQGSFDPDGLRQRLALPRVPTLNLNPATSRPVSDTAEEAR